MADEETKAALVMEATQLLAEIAMGGGVITSEQSVRAQDFVMKSITKNATPVQLPQQLAA